MATPWGIAEPGIELRRGAAVECIEVEQADRYRLQSDNFSRAVRGLEPPLLGREDALGQARAIDALYRSAGQGGEPASAPVGRQAVAVRVVFLAHRMAVVRMRMPRQPPAVADVAVVLP